MNEDEDAALLALGPARMILDHVRETFSEAATVAMTAVASVPGLVMARSMMSILPPVLGFGINFALIVRNWIIREREADFAAMLLMAEAGFDPKALALVLEKQQKFSEDHPYAKRSEYVQPFFGPPCVLQITGRQAIPASMTNKDRRALLAKKKRWEDFKRSRPQGLDGDSETGNHDSWPQL
ncbi:MAG: hypothetical protein Q9169_002818 [Polycauliona sp. 2 TL-2023]